MAKKKSVLVFSYFSGTQGNCPAEWADDKVKGLLEKFDKVHLVTSLGSKAVQHENVKTIKVPSLSWNDFKIELDSEREISGSIPLSAILIGPVAFTLGQLFDYLIKKITKGISAGKWSWALTGFLAGIINLIKIKPDVVLATGGPMSAQVAGALLTYFTRIKLITEFQDPLLGAMMQRSSATRLIASKLESWLLRRAIRAVYVTKSAAEQVRERNPLLKDKVEAIYPGAWNYKIPKKQSSENNETIELLHLGTLYGSRNLDFLFQAIDALLLEGVLKPNKIKIVNVGSVYLENVKDYRERSDFKEIESMNRVNALRRASNTDGLILVQHSDERSKETIPYKTYDYFNLNIPIIGILNNKELEDLIVENSGLTSRQGDVESIKDALKSFLQTIDNNKVPYNSFEFSEQIEKLMR